MNEREEAALLDPALRDAAADLQLAAAAMIAQLRECGFTAPQACACINGAVGGILGRMLEEAR